MTTNCSTIICFVRDNDKECQLVNDQVVLRSELVHVAEWFSFERMSNLCYSPTTNAAAHSDHKSYLKWNWRVSNGICFFWNLSLLYFGVFSLASPHQKKTLALSASSNVRRKTTARKREKKMGKQLAFRLFVKWKARYLLRLIHFSS